MTIFSVQRFIQDHFARRHLDDVDQYAIRVANLYDRLGPEVAQETLVAGLSRVSTTFFRRNEGVNRHEFEAQLADTLRSRFKKKSDAALAVIEEAIPPARARLRTQRRSTGALLDEFRSAVESRAIDVFWDSRVDKRLRTKPEQVAQSLLAVFAKGVLGQSGLTLRELSSGIGFVDVAIVFGRVLHLIEMKVLKGKLVGPNQLANYMRTERRPEGWLVLVDARRDQSDVIPEAIVVPEGRIKVVLINVNPVAPHSR